MSGLETAIGELEARDARVAAELTRVEAAQSEVDALRAQAEAAAETLAWLPQAASENAYALDQARRARDEAAAVVDTADDESRPAAEAALAAAERAVARLDEHRRAFAEQERETRRRAGELVAGVGGADSLDEALALLSQRRGALLVEHSQLARERDAVVREASELLALVTGDPSASTSVAGLRARLT
jgi:chromosome segregation ATPase